MSDRAAYMRAWRAAHPGYDPRDPEHRREYMRRYMRKRRAKPTAKPAVVLPAIPTAFGWPTREQLMGRR